MIILYEGVSFVVGIVVVGYLVNQTDGNLLATVTSGKAFRLVPK